MKRFEINEAPNLPTFTEDELKNSSEFKEAITGRISAIHMVAANDGGLPLFLVFHSSMGKFTITKFHKSPNKKTELDKIRFSNVETDISVDELIQFFLNYDLNSF